MTKRIEISLIQRDRQGNLLPLEEILKQVDESLTKTGGPENVYSVTSLKDRIIIWYKVNY